MVLIAKERIDLLMREADVAALSGSLDMADRYVEMARRVGMRYNVRIPREYRRRFCRGCYGYMLPGVTSRTRFNRGRLVTTCKRCGHIARMPLMERPASGDSRAEGEANDDGQRA